MPAPLGPSDSCCDRDVSMGGCRDYSCPGEKGADYQNINSTRARIESVLFTAVPLPPGRVPGT